MLLHPVASRRLAAQHHTAQHGSKQSSNSNFPFDFCDPSSPGTEERSTQPQPLRSWTEDRGSWAHGNGLDIDRGRPCMYSSSLQVREDACMHVASRLWTWTTNCPSSPACSRTCLQPRNEREAASANSTASRRQPCRVPSFQACSRGTGRAGDRHHLPLPGNSTSDCPLLIDQCISTTLVS